MRYRSTHTLGAVLTVAATALLPRAGAAANADAVATDKIRDLTATLTVVDGMTHFDELKKIGGDFATTYRFKRMEVSYKNPNRTRLEAKIAGVGILLVFNGDTKMVKAPFRKQVKSVAGEPAQKQSLLHLGIFAKDFLKTDYAPTFLRKEGKLEVYKLTQRNSDNKSHDIVWVNPKTSVIEKRVSMQGEHTLRMTTLYKNPKEVRPGIWVPTRLEIYNQQGKLGAAQDYENVKVNLGVADSKFATT